MRKKKLKLSLIESPNPDYIMAFISGIQIIDAPAGALNNAGPSAAQSENKNAVTVKSMWVGRGMTRRHLPYVSAQAYRRWLRDTLESLGSDKWTASPIFREKKVAYVDGNPIKYADDDILGYMRAQGGKVDATKSREGRIGATPLEKKGKKHVTITRVSPFRAGTLVGMSDGITKDSGTMSRHEGDPVPHDHEFYRTSLKGMFSLDLGSVGAFTYENRTGYLNLDSVRREQAEEAGLEQDEEAKVFRLPIEERSRRAATLLRAMPVITGGAKLALHYTDVSPVVVVAAAMEGGNNPFQYVVSGDSEGRARANLDALREIAEVWGDTLLSPLYIGWVTGYASEHRKELMGALEELRDLYPHGVKVGHPKQMLEALADSVKEHARWMEA